LAGAANEVGSEDVAGFRLRGPTVLVMGSEGFGLRTTVRNSCQVLLSIPGVAQPETDRPCGVVVDSLNVSVATGILLHHLLMTRQALGALD
jgi:21S rRNA (GM2251-2'-O)-methyltransferase